MSKQILAEILVNEWKLANGWTPARILQEYFASEQWRVKTASEKAMDAEARVLVAGITMDFVKDLAAALKTSWGSVVELLKNSKIIKFFSAIGWSFKYLYDLMKKGYRTYKELRKVFGEYVANTKVGHWTNEELKKLDEYLQNHPTTRRLSGLALGGLLLYLWFYMADIGDPEWDFDMSDIFDALSGRYSFSGVFGGADGVILLVTLLTGSMISFPWFAPNSVLFIAAVINTVIKKLRVRFRSEKPRREESEKELSELLV
jgi:hypothetical protein